MTTPTRLVVAEDSAQSRLDRYLRRQIEGLTQGVIQKLCRTGKIRIDGQRAEAGAHLAAGAIITLPPIAPPTAPSRTRQVVVMDAHMIRDLEAMILYRDASVILLNKPPGLPTQGGSGIAVHLDGMLDALREGGERPKLVHRLDRDTSGVLLLARGAAAAARLAAGFRGRDVEKRYWALLSGVPQPLAGRIDLPLARIASSGSARAEPADRRDPDADKALTDYLILDHAGRKFAWAELAPQTGRMHQLRAHCLALGTPIVGDAAYGAAMPEGFAPQLHLHARSLSFPHPEGGRLTVEAEPPKHLREAFAHLGFTMRPAAKPVRHG